MKSLKTTVIYLSWIIIALLLGLSYMRIILGPNNVSKEGIGYLWHLFYNLGLFHTGLIIGLTIALLFLILDIFYLDKKLENNLKSNIIRFGVLLIITTVIVITHYILEKVFDVI